MERRHTTASRSPALIAFPEIAPHGEALRYGAAPHMVTTRGQAIHRVQYSHWSGRNLPLLRRAPMDHNAQA